LAIVQYWSIMAYLQWYTVCVGSQPPSPKLTPEEKLWWRNSRHSMSKWNQVIKMESSDQRSS